MSTFDPSLRKATPPVIAHLPASLTEGIALDVLFRAPDQVDVRPAIVSSRWAAWTPLEQAGGQVEVRVR